MDKLETKNKDKGAFACVDPEYLQEGLTKREYFAAKAMQGILGNQEFLKNLNADPDLVVTGILEISDKLLDRLRNDC